MTSALIDGDTTVVVVPKKSSRSDGGCGGADCWAGGCLDSVDTFVVCGWLEL